MQERIGMMHRVSGRYAEARESFGLSLARRVALAAEQPSNAEIQRDIAVTRQDLCEVERALLRPGPALEHCRAAFALYEQMHATDPRNAQARSDLAAGARSLAAAQAEVGDAAPALRTLERGIAVLRPALDDEPANRPNRLSLARLLAQHTLLARSSGRRAAFASEARAALQALRADSVAEAEDSSLIAAIAKS